VDEPCLARAAAGLILAVKVRKHDFMREERRPFKGIGAFGYLPTKIFSAPPAETPQRFYRVQLLP